MPQILKTCLILFLALSMLSCKTYRKTTFLDFEFGMTWDEYIVHARNLQSSGIIKNLNGRTFEYSLDLGNGKFAFFNVVINVFGNSRLSYISADLKYDLNEQEEKILLNNLESKYGSPTDPYKKFDEKLWRAAWDQKTSSIVFLMGGYNGSIIYSAEGSLYDNIKAKDKKESGDIDVKNKY
jgi:hypothetical protein